MVGVTKKAGLILMIKKRLRLRAKLHTKPPLMVKSCLKLIYNHNIATTTSLTPNSGAFL